jgi:hypothetical protein
MGSTWEFIELVGIRVGLLESVKRVSRNASVGSTDAANEAVARFGVVGPKRARRLQERTESIADR